jgi:ABC-type branched-subunit amino acid transport system permease subunit
MFLDRLLLKDRLLISGSNELPQCISGRFVYVVAHLAVAVLLAAYSAFLISYLTFRRPVLPFSSFSEFLNDSTYQLGANAASSYLRTFDTVSLYTICRFGEVNHTVR